MIKYEDKLEFIGQIIDIFEDFLEEKGIDIPNEDKTDEDNTAIIYGCDYGDLQTNIEEMMKNWGIIDVEKKTVCLSFAALYKHNIRNLFYGGYIQYMKSGKTEYYDLMNETGMLGCDREIWEIECTDECSVELSNKLDGKIIVLSREEYNIATFK